MSITTAHPASRLVLSAISILGIVWVMLCAGCSFSYQAPKLGRYGNGPAPKPPIFLALGELGFTEPWITGSNVVRFKTAFGEGVERTSNTNLLHFVVQATNLPPQPSCLILSGTISEIKKSGGSAALLLALGAERWRVAGSFQVRDTGGTLLTEFTGEYHVSSEAWGVGVGVSGPSLVNWEYVASGLGGAVAEEINRWLEQKKTVRATGT